MNISDLNGLPVSQDDIIEIHFADHRPRNTALDMMSPVHWYPVSQRPPGTKKDFFIVRAFLVILADKRITLAWYNRMDNEWLESNQIIRLNVTHWAFMPDLPPAMR